MLDLAKLRIYCADIGSVRPHPRTHEDRFGWARDCGPGGDIEVRRGGATISELTDLVSADLVAGLPVSLGFECPLWIPLPDDPMLLGQARTGEDKSWSASAGAGALVTGLPEVAWILREVRRKLGRPPAFFLDWTAFNARGEGVFLWEAFVTGKAKAETHQGDAEVALRCFLRCIQDPTAASLPRMTEVYSLLGAALLRAEWSDDLQMLRKPCLVLRA